MIFDKKAIESLGLKTEPAKIITKYHKNTTTCDGCVLGRHITVGSSNVCKSVMCSAQKFIVTNPNNFNLDELTAKFNMALAHAPEDGNYLAALRAAVIKRIQKSAAL